MKMHNQNRTQVNEKYNAIPAEVRTKKTSSWKAGLVIAFISLLFASATVWLLLVNKENSHWLMYTPMAIGVFGLFMAGNVASAEFRNYGINYTWATVKDIIETLRRK